MPTGFSRRLLGQSLVLGAASTAFGTAGAKPSGAKLDLTGADSQIQAFMKLFLTAGSGRIWYWYTGTITSHRPGEPIRPFVSTCTLIRRDVRQTGYLQWEVLNYEANYYGSPGSLVPVDSFVSPLNGRLVIPQHYREGPYTVAYSTQAPYLAGHPPKEPKPFSLPWHVVGDEVWDSVEYYFDEPHPLPMHIWKLESSGPRLTSGSFATHTGNANEVADPAINAARCTFNYEAVMGWLPWLLMGQQPGGLVWRANGRKLASLADVPPISMAGFQKTHPRIFHENPWEERSNMWIDYVRDRKPAPT